MDSIVDFSNEENKLSFFSSSDLYPVNKVQATININSLQKPVPEKLVKINPGKFTTVLAHEVRNPLTNINLSVQMLEREIADERMKLYIAIIKRSSVRINELLNEVLTFEHEEDIPSERYNIHELLDEVLEMAGDRFVFKNISLSRQYDVADCEMMMKKLKLKIALTNIVINAIDAMPEKNGLLIVKTKSGDDYFTLRIEDNGCGISTENLKNIFKPFYTNKPEGVGLGLASTYDILKANNIAISVESDEGKGTSFILTFKKEPAFKLKHI